MFFPKTLLEPSLQYLPHSFLNIVNHKEFLTERAVREKVGDNKVLVPLVSNDQSRMSKEKKWNKEIGIQKDW